MSGTVLEKRIEDYPGMISLKNTKIIISQMEKSICQITKNGNNGTGFFTKIKFSENEIRTFLVTNYHVLGEDCLNDKNIFIKMIDKKEIYIPMDRPRKTYNNKELDVTFIEIREEDGIKSFLELDNDLEKKEDQIEEKLKKKSIYIIQYPRDEICVSFGIINFFNDFNINYFCNTENGSSGSPILSLESFKIIGIHKQSNNNRGYNTGSLLKKAIEDFKIKFLAEINNNNNYFKNNKNLYNLNTNISFKNTNKIIKMNEMNIQYSINENDEGIKIFGEEFVKNNKDNCILTFNNKDYELCDYIKYNEYKINKNDFIFEVVLKEKKKITDMSQMFHGCESLICIYDIDKWDTQHVTNMSKMFELCSSLCSLPSSLDWNTSQVTDISNMFSGCTNLSDIPDISKWDISNVNNIQGMFKYCENLKTLPDISNWNTSKITDMSEMFCCCKSLTKLPNISKWEIKNVMNMRDMFFCCENLTYIPNISNWNTINVTNMNHMFGGCKSLKSLPDISNWNTNKCKTEKKDIFYKCNKELIKNYNY